MPAGMIAMLLSMLALAVMYAMLCQGGSGVAEGDRLGAIFGAPIGVFAIGAFLVTQRRQPKHRTEAEWPTS